MSKHISATQIPDVSPILSEDYSDIIFRYQSSPESLFDELASYAPQLVDIQYIILHAPRNCRKMYSTLFYRATSWKIAMRCWSCEPAPAEMRLHSS